MEISLEEETKLQKETDAEFIAAEKKIKELTKLLDDARSKVCVLMVLANMNAAHYQIETHLD